MTPKCRGAQRAANGRRAGYAAIAGLSILLAVAAAAAEAPAPPAPPEPAPSPQAPAPQAPAPQAPSPEPGPGQTARPKPSSLTTLSILPFLASVEADKELGERMAEELEVLLSESGRFRILTRTQLTLEKMNELIALQAKQGKEEQRAPFQRLSCEEAFVCGSLRLNEDQSYTIYLHVISLASGEKIVALRGRCWHKNAFRRVARAFTNEIVNRVDIIGAVVKIAGDKFFVELSGGADGVKRGDYLAARHPSQTIKVADRTIDVGEEPPFATLAVEAITASGHVRCVSREKGGEQPREGDRVRLIPVCPAQERREVAAVLPFGFTGPAAANEAAEREQFSALVQREILVAAPKLRGMDIANPPGATAYASASADGRVVCDDLGVDAVLKGDIALFDKELRCYLDLVIHRQSDTCDVEGDQGEPVVRKRASVALDDSGKLTVKAATLLAEAVVKALADEEKKEPRETAPPPASSETLTGRERLSLAEGDAVAKR